jgi:uncharacterized Zn finger protein
MSTIPWQIAPDYENHHESSSSTEDDSTEDEEEPRFEEIHDTSTRPPLVDEQPDTLEKAETQQDNLVSAAPTRPTTLQKGRTRSSRKEEQCAPVGFWHYKMVRVFFQCGT